jgi:hypothetical protein
MRNGIAAILAVATSVWLAGCASDPVPSESTILRYQVDSASQRTWWLTRDGVFVQGASQTKPIAVALPGWAWVGAAYSCPPDVALGPKGEALITSNVLPVLWRIDPQTLAVSVHGLTLDSDTDKDVGFSGLVYSAEQATFLAFSDIQGSLWRIDPLLASATKIGRLEHRASCTELSRRLIELASSKESQ